MNKLKYSIIAIIVVFAAIFINVGLNTPSKEQPVNTIKEDSLIEAYRSLEFYTMDIEDICDKYKSSREAKENLHKTKYPSYRNGK